ncbi:MAG: hypothetical protein ABL982_17515 [Vicinamibacterales bacterium]
MSAFSSWAGGWRRVRRSPVLVLVLWLATIAVTIPPALVLRQEMRTHLGESLASDAATDGVNYEWWQEIRKSASPLGQTLRTDVIGFATVMDNASGLADMTPRAMPLISAGAVFILLVWFITPGIIHRLATDAPPARRGLVAVSGTFAGRMLRFGLVSSVVYGVLFGSLHAWLFDELFDTLTHNLTVERTAFVIRLGLYLAFFALVAGVNLLFDIAKVRLVVEDRHSVLAAINAGARFIGANPALAIGAYALNVMSFALVIAAYALVAPGAATGMWAAFAVGQAYIAGRVAVKVAFWAGAVDALQRAFHCPGFVRTA